MSVSIELRPLTRDGANAAIKQWHSHHKPVRSHRFAIGAYVGEVLVGAVIVGNPIAAALAADPCVGEVLRLVTNRHPHVASRLLGAARRAAQAMGYRKLISYTREDELGTCYRAAGWQAVARVDGEAWNHGNKAHRWLPGLYVPTTEVVDRVRWEVRCA